MAETHWFAGDFGIVPIEVLADPDLKIRTKLVLAALASHAGADGRTPAISKKTIASRAGLPPTNLAREIRELVESGWLEVQRQPGANSIYRLKTPGARPRSAPEPASPVPAPEERLADAPVISKIATVTMVARHGSSWHVAFSLEDDSRVGTIFTDCDKPCEPGDTANIKVREWKGRKGIAGGAANGIQWIRHKPVPPPIEAKSFELLVADFKRFGTPTGLIYVSFSAEGNEIKASAMLAERQLPADVTNGSRIRVSRSDGGLMTVGRVEAHLDISGNGFVVELA